MMRMQSVRIYRTNSTQPMLNPSAVSAGLDSVAMEPSAKVSTFSLRLPYENTPSTFGAIYKEDKDDFLCSKI